MQFAAVGLLGFHGFSMQGQTPFKTRADAPFCLLGVRSTMAMGAGTHVGLTAAPACGLDGETIGSLCTSPNNQGVLDPVLVGISLPREERMDTWKSSRLMRRSSSSSLK